MAARLKRMLKTWMFIYVAFAAALLAGVANGVPAGPEIQHVPQLETTGAALERRFFETRLAQTARTDI